MGNIPLQPNAIHNKLQNIILSIQKKNSKAILKKDFFLKDVCFTKKEK